MYEIVAILALVTFLYSVIGARIERTPFGGAIVFTAVGFALGGHGFGLIGDNFGVEALSTLAQLTLALVLFSDAANADLKELTRSAILPRRLLLVSLPITIAFGFAIGVPLFWGTLGLVEIAILATILAPTDAALGKAVVTDPNVPGHLRTCLNVESGLNDGICVPIFLTFLIIATHAGGDASFDQIATELLIHEVGIGALTGVTLAAAGAWIVGFCEDRGWVDDIWRQLLVPALSIASYSAAQSLHGSGFIAAFLGGLVFGALVRRHKHAALRAAEGVGGSMSLLTWVVFGALVIGDALEAATWPMVVYAVLSLTLVRMLPAWLSLSGTALRSDEKLYLGWFGPRGLASVVFTAMLLDADVPGAQVIALTVSCAILMSVIAHGMSAGPLSRALAGRLRGGGAS